MITASANDDSASLVSLRDSIRYLYRRTIHASVIENLSMDWVLGLSGAPPVIFLFHNPSDIGRSALVVSAFDCGVRKLRFESHHGRLCLS